MPRKILFCFCHTCLWIFANFLCLEFSLRLLSIQKETLSTKMMNSQNQNTFLTWSSSVDPFGSLFKTFWSSAWLVAFILGVHPLETRWVQSSGQLMCPRSSVLVLIMHYWGDVFCFLTIMIWYWPARSDGNHCCYIVTLSTCLLVSELIHNGWPS